MRILLDDGRWNWLEEQTAPECLDWVKNETRLTTEYLDGLPHSKELQDNLTQLAENNTPPPKYFLAESIFRWRQDIDHRHGVIEMSEDGSVAIDSWKTVFDIDDFGKSQGKTYEFANHSQLSTHVLMSSEFRRLLLLLSEGGSDLVEIYEVDIDTGLIISDGFYTPAGRQSVAWLDINHVLITHCLNDGPTTVTGWPTNSYIWTRGTDLKTAKLVHSIPSSDALIETLAIGAGLDRRGMLLHCLDYSTIHIYTVSLDGKVERAKLPAKIAMMGNGVTTSRHIVVSLTEAAIVGGKEVPLGTLVAWDVFGAHQRATIVYIPEDGECNPGLLAAGLAAGHSRVYQILSRRGKQRRVVSEYQSDNTWKVIQSIDIPTGSEEGIISTDQSNNKIIVSQSGLLTPTQFWIEDQPSAKTVIYAQAAAFNSDDYTVEVKAAESKDGTSIDYVFLAPKKPKSPLPTLMTGYGAFGITLSIQYLNTSVGGVSLVPWLESGGALVIALIRGGGDRGEEWHQAAMREKRQKSYDDFIAVAETLIKNGTTTPKNLGVFGTSNGGLLAGVMGTQRPDLFGAIVSNVPLTDMIRFPLMGMGAAWIDEYGDPNDPLAASVLLSYSPFHRVRPGVKYPPFLVTSSTTDDRVGAGHARKLAAKLKDFGATAYFFEQGEGGHGVSDPFKNSLLLARRIAFLISELQ